MIDITISAKSCNFTKGNSPPCIFFMFFKSCKWYKIGQSIIYIYNNKAMSTK